MNKFDIEGFASLQEIQSQTQILSDMELKTYLNSLTPAQQADLLAGNVANSVADVQANKETAYIRAFNNVTNSNNAITQAGYYLARTLDMNTMASDINQVAAKQASAAMVNKELATRQYQINEWSSSNKLDTLFFFQVLLIALTLSAALFFLVKQGMMPMFLFTILSMILLAGALLVLFMRWRYTSTVRDGVYWSRRRFPA